MPRATQLFAPTFLGQGVVRLDDMTRDPRTARTRPTSACRRATCR